MSEPIKKMAPEIWFWDIETVPCVETGRKVYPVIYDPQKGEPTDADVLAEMYRQNGATQDEPRPMLKTVFQRVVAISALVRKQPTRNGPVQLSLHSLPTDENFDEPTIIETFLGQIGTRRPQIVGFNHSGFDIPVLFQRAIIHGIELKEFSVRPEKPWDPLPDYFNDKNDWNVDLKNVIGGWGKATPKLSEIARACGIPSKVSADGGEVARMWQEGKRREIVNYCDEDVLTTYLLWLRTALVSGLITAGAYNDETATFADTFAQLSADKPHVRDFLNQWQYERSTTPSWYREKGDELEAAA